eukprot:TRINITY_DN69281_c0_g1_i1.p1 TRINITY_DN69281_c0_g1~~TRINITY_DN69281_c0_g1_i1.p1  ORF type:complete len:1313 (+),score=299.99 TRINITY_DN69281_c0_g1_i1:197-4135(+)
MSKAVLPDREALKDVKKHLKADDITVKELFEACEKIDIKPDEAIAWMNQAIGDAEFNPKRKHIHKRFRRLAVRRPLKQDDSKQKPKIDTTLKEQCNFIKKTNDGAHVCRNMCIRHPKDRSRMLKTCGYHTSICFLDHVDGPRDIEALNEHGLCLAHFVAKEHKRPPKVTDRVNAPGVEFVLRKPNRRPGHCLAPHEFEDDDDIKPSDSELIPTEPLYTLPWYLQVLPFSKRYVIRLKRHGDDAATVIQSIVRMRQTHGLLSRLRKMREYEKREKAARIIQPIMRGTITRIWIATIKKKMKLASIDLQRTARGFMARKRVRRLKAAIAIQRIVRGHIIRKELAIKNIRIGIRSKRIKAAWAAALIARMVKGFLARRAYRLQQEQIAKELAAAITIQNFSKRIAARKRFLALLAWRRREINSALLLQRFFRGWAARKRFWEFIHTALSAVRVIQPIVRGFLGRLRASEERAEIQKAWDFLGPVDRSLIESMLPRNRIYIVPEHLKPRRPRRKSAPPEVKAVFDFNLPHKIWSIEPFYKVDVERRGFLKRKLFLRVLQNDFPCSLSKPAVEKIAHLFEIVGKGNIDYKSFLMFARQQNEPCYDHRMYACPFCATHGECENCSCISYKPNARGEATPQPLCRCGHNLHTHIVRPFNSVLAKTKQNLDYGSMFHLKSALNRSVKVSSKYGAESVKGINLLPTTATLDGTLPGTNVQLTAVSPSKARATTKKLTKLSEKVSKILHQQALDDLSAEYINTSPPPRPDYSLQCLLGDDDMPFIMQGKLMSTRNKPELYVTLMLYFGNPSFDPNHDRKHAVDVIFRYCVFLEQYWQRLVRDIKDGTIDPSVGVDEGFRKMLQASLAPNPRMSQRLERILKKLGFHKRTSKAITKAVSSKKGGKSKRQQKIEDEEESSELSSSSEDDEPFHSLRNDFSLPKLSRKAFSAKTLKLTPGPNDELDSQNGFGRKAINITVKSPSHTVSTSTPPSKRSPASQRNSTNRRRRMSSPIQQSKILGLPLPLLTSPTSRSGTSPSHSPAKGKFKIQKSCMAGELKLYFQGMPTMVPPERAPTRCQIPACSKHLAFPTVACHACRQLANHFPVIPCAMFGTVKVTLPTGTAFTIRAGSKAVAIKMVKNNRMITGYPLCICKDAKGVGWVGCAVLIGKREARKLRIRRRLHRKELLASEEGIWIRLESFTGTAMVLDCQAEEFKRREGLDESIRFCSGIVSDALGDLTSESVFSGSATTSSTYTPRSSTRRSTRSSSRYSYGYNRYSTASRSSFRQSTSTFTRSSESSLRGSKSNQSYSLSTFSEVSASPQA